MTIYGVRIEQERGSLKQMNRFYVNEANQSEAIDFGLQAAGILIGMFGPVVTFTNVHVWTPGVTPNVFTNQPMAFGGDAGVAAEALPAEIVVRWRFPVDGSYTNYKDFRTGVNAPYCAGEVWGSTYLGLIETCRDAFAGLMGLYNLCTRTGTPLGLPVADEQLRFHQLSPKWYNRS